MSCLSTDEGATETEKIVEPKRVVAEKLSNEDRHTKKLQHCPANVFVVCLKNCLPCDAVGKKSCRPAMNLFFLFVFAVCACEVVEPMLRFVLLSGCKKVFVHRDRNVANFFVCQPCEAVKRERVVFAQNEINLLLSRHRINENLSKPALSFVLSHCQTVLRAAKLSSEKLSWLNCC